MEGRGGVRFDEGRQVLQWEGARNDVYLVGIQVRDGDIDAGVAGPAGGSALAAKDQLGPESHENRDPQCRTKKTRTRSMLGVWGRWVVCGRWSAPSSISSWLVGPNKGSATRSGGNFGLVRGVTGLP